MRTSRLSAVKGDDEMEPISDLDARVLESLLEDKSLDLKSEESLKKMLKTGVKKKEVSDEGVGKKEILSEFSSSFFRTLDDNELWNSLRAKTDSLIESAKIFVQNRVERDAQLLASIGVFAWQRAVKDASRALPSKGKSGAGMAKKMRDSLFLLKNNSSFVQYIPEDNFILPPSKYSEGVETSVFEELNTPMDEIKSVSQAIRDILSGKSVSQDRGLRSVAPAGLSRNEERQRMAYERKKETVLKREKEGIDTKVLRATGSLTDGIAELKREMEVEGNEAGYRAKNAQKQLEGTLESAGLLGSGPDKTFRGIGERLFGVRNVEKSNFLIDRTDDIYMEEIEIFPELTKDDVNEERRRLVDRLKVCLESPGDTWLTPETTVVVNKSNLDDTSPQESGEIPFYANSGNIPESSPKQPAAVSISEESWEQVITTMVLTRNDIEVQTGDDYEVFNNENEVLIELQDLKKRVDIICILAAASAGYEASEALKYELIGQEKDKIDQIDQNSLLSCLETIMSYREDQRVAAEERRREAEAQNIADMEKMNESKSTVNSNKSKFEAQNVVDVIESSVTPPPYDESIEPPQNYEDSSTDVIETVVVCEILPGEAVAQPRADARKQVKEPLLADVEFEISRDEVNYVNNYNDDESIDNSVYAQVEIVEDDGEQGIFSFSENDDMNLNSAAFDESSTEEVTATSTLAKFALRSVDVVLFILEKTFTVGFPGVFNAYSIVSERTNDVRRQGMGKEGWSRLENIDDASKRY